MMIGMLIRVWRKMKARLETQQSIYPGSLKHEMEKVIHEWGTCLFIY